MEIKRADTSAGKNELDYRQGKMIVEHFLDVDAYIFDLDGNCDMNYPVILSEDYVESVRLNCRTKTDEPVDDGWIYNTIDGADDMIYRLLCGNTSITEIPGLEYSFELRYGIRPYISCGWESSNEDWPITFFFGFGDALTTKGDIFNPDKSHVGMIISSKPVTSGPWTINQFCYDIRDIYQIPFGDITRDLLYTPTAFNGGPLFMDGALYEFIIGINKNKPYFGVYDFMSKRTAKIQLPNAISLELLAKPPIHGIEVGYNAQYEANYAAMDIEYIRLMYNYYPDAAQEIDWQGGY